MTTPMTTAPTRRSALDATHRRLTAPGATDPRLQWPMSYGDPDGERHAVAEAIGLAEPGLYDKWIVRGPGALAACRSMGLDARPGQVLPAAPGGISAWAIADDEVWLLTYGPDPGAPPLPPANAAAAVARLRAGGALVTDVSSGWSVLRLVGPRVRDLLEELVAEDLAPDALPDQAIRHVPMAACRVVLSRRDHDGIPGFTLLVARDEAEYLWDVLAHLGEAYGLRPVGASALLGPAPGAPVTSAAEPPAAAGAGR